MTNQIINLIRQILNEVKIPYWKKPENLIAISSIIIAFMLGYFQMKQNENLSNQAQKIEDFKDLIDENKKQNQKISETIGLLNKQLEILNKQLELNNEEYKTKMSNNEIKLKVTFLELINLDMNFEKQLDYLSDYFADPNDFEKVKYLSKVEEILKSGLENPYLLKNTNLYIQWSNTYTEVINFHSKNNVLSRNEKLIKEFLELENRVSTLKNNVKSYMIEKNKSRTNN